MNNAQRAKIFAPYAALKGFGDFILAAQHTTRERVFLGEDAAADLNRQLQTLRRGDIIAVTYYLRDDYVEVCGAVRRISPEEEQLTVGGVKIPFGDILSVRRDER